jgi:hypothetical protein
MSTRIYATLDLAFDGEWRVGVWKSGDRSVLTFTTDRGHPYLPGASVRGSLRAHVHESLGAARAAASFGPDAESPDLSASPWWVLAAVLVPGSGDKRERGQTAIDRTRRAPASGTQRTSATVTALGTGPHVRVYLRCDAALADPVADDVIRALGTWRPRLGGGSSVGLGRARVVSGRYRDLDLGARAGLITRLVAGNTPAGIDELLTDPAAKSLTVKTHPDVVLLSCDFDLPHGWAAQEPSSPLRPVMDGSTWKGLVRSRVEFIGRSLGARVCSTSACGTCDVCAVFGSPKEVSVLDFASTPIDRRGSAGVRTRKRNALSRFTGGVNDRQFFNEHSEHDLRLRLEIRALARRHDVDDAGNPQTPTTPAWVIQAILHTVRDLGQGLVGVGGQSSTGLGTLQTTCLRLGGAWRELVGEIADPDGKVELEALDRLPVEAGHE